MDGRKNILKTVSTDAKIASWTNTPEDLESVQMFNTRMISKGAAIHQTGDCSNGGPVGTSGIYNNLKPRMTNGFVQELNGSASGCSLRDAVVEGPINNATERMWTPFKMHGCKMSGFGMKLSLAEGTTQPSEYDLWNQTSPIIGGEPIIYGTRTVMGGSTSAADDCNKENCHSLPLNQLVMYDNDNDKKSNAPIECPNQNIVSPKPLNVTDNAYKVDFSDVITSDAYLGQDYPHNVSDVFNRPANPAVCAVRFHGRRRRGKRSGCDGASAAVSTSRQAACDVFERPQVLNNIPTESAATASETCSLSPMTHLANMCKNIDKESHVLPRNGPVKNVTHFNVTDMNVCMPAPDADARCTIVRSPVTTMRDGVQTRMSDESLTTGIVSEGGGGVGFVVRPPNKLTTKYRRKSSNVAREYVMTLQGSQSDTAYYNAVEIVDALMCFEKDPPVHTDTSSSAPSNGADVLNPTYLSGGGDKEQICLDDTYSIISEAEIGDRNVDFDDILMVLGGATHAFENCTALPDSNIAMPPEPATEVFRACLNEPVQSLNVEMCTTAVDADRHVERSGNVEKSNTIVGNLCTDTCAMLPVVNVETYRIVLDEATQTDATITGVQFEGSIGDQLEELIRTTCGPPCIDSLEDVTLYANQDVLMGDISTQTVYSEACGIIQMCDADSKSATGACPTGCDGTDTPMGLYDGVGDDAMCGGDQGGGTVYLPGDGVHLNDAAFKTNPVEIIYISSDSEDDEIVENEAVCNGRVAVTGVTSNGQGGRPSVIKLARALVVAQTPEGDGCVSEGVPALGMNSTMNVGISNEALGVIPVWDVTTRAVGGCGVSLSALAGTTTTTTTTTNCGVVAMDTTPPVDSFVHNNDGGDGVEAMPRSVCATVGSVQTTTISPANALEKVPCAVTPSVMLRPTVSCAADVAVPAADPNTCIDSMNLEPPSDPNRHSNLESNSLPPTTQPKKRKNKNTPSSQPPDKRRRTTASANRRQRGVVATCKTLIHRCSGLEQIPENVELFKHIESRVQQLLNNIDVFKHHPTEPRGDAIKPRSGKPPCKERYKTPTPPKTTMGAAPQVRSAPPTSARDTTHSGLNGYHQANGTVRPFWGPAPQNYTIVKLNGPNHDKENQPPKNSSNQPPKNPRINKPITARPVRGEWYKTPIAPQVTNAVTLFAMSGPPSSSRITTHSGLGGAPDPPKLNAIARTRGGPKAVTTARQTKDPEVNRGTIHPWLSGVQSPGTPTSHSVEAPRVAGDFNRKGTSLPRDSTIPKRVAGPEGLRDVTSSGHSGEVRKALGDDTDQSVALPEFFTQVKIEKDWDWATMSASAQMGRSTKLSPAKHTSADSGRAPHGGDDSA